MKIIKPTSVKFQDNMKDAVKVYANKYYRGNVSQMIDLIVAKAIKFDHTKDYSEILKQMKR